MFDVLQCCSKPSFNQEFVLTILGSVEAPNWCNLEGFPMQEDTQALQALRGEQAGLRGLLLPLLDQLFGLSEGLLSLQRRLLERSESRRGIVDLS